MELYSQQLPRYTNSNAGASIDDPVLLFNLGAETPDNHQGAEPPSNYQDLISLYLYSKKQQTINSTKQLPASNRSTF